MTLQKVSVTPVFHSKTKKELYRIKIYRLLSHRLFYANKSLLVLYTEASEGIVIPDYFYEWCKMYFRSLAVMQFYRKILYYDSLVF